VQVSWYELLPLADTEVTVGRRACCAAPTEVQIQSCGPFVVNHRSEIKRAFADSHR
jgi:hypothetical protein